MMNKYWPIILVLILLAFAIIGEPTRASAEFDAMTCKQGTFHTDACYRIVDYQFNNVCYGSVGGGIVCLKMEP